MLGVAHLGTTEFTAHVAFSFSVLVLGRTSGKDFIWDHLKMIKFSGRNSVLPFGLPQGNMETHMFSSTDCGRSLSRMDGDI